MKKGKLKMQGYVAVQKKLPVIMWALWRKEERFGQECTDQIIREQNSEKRQGTSKKVAAPKTATQDISTLKASRQILSFELNI